MVFAKLGLAAGLLFAVLGYVFYVPLPDDAVEPWKQLLIKAIMRIVFGSGYFAEIFGYNRINFTRALGDGKPGITPDESIDVYDSKFDGVDVRIYKPRNRQENGPGLVYIHGGGWIYGTIASYDTLVRRLSKSSGFVTISIGYRRAPEHVFPAAFDDCLAATLFFFKNAKQYGVDPTKIGITGDSAGGNLAAAVTLKLSTDKNIRFKPKFQSLICPALQATDLNLPSYRKYDDDNGPFILAKPIVVKFWLYYGTGNLDYFSEFFANNHTSPELKRTKYFKYISRNRLPIKYLSAEGKLPVSSGNNELFSRVSKWLLNPYFAPLMATDDDLITLPATYMLTAEYDPIRDDGFLFVNRLQSLKKEVQHDHYDGLNHGFVFLDFLHSTDKAIDKMIQFFHNQMFEDEETVKANLGL